MGKNGEPSRGVRHVIGCQNEECDVGQSNIAAIEGRRPDFEPRFFEGQVVVEDGVVYFPEDERHLDRELRAIRCGICDEAMQVVYVAVNIGSGSGRSTSRLGGGVTVDSPDRTVCAAGREFVGVSALQALRPGESGVLSIGGIGVAATRSPGGDRVSVVRADEAARRR